MTGEGADPDPGGEGTLRQRIERILEAGEATIADLSRLARASERLIPDALDHLRRSLSAQGGELVQRPAECRECGFVFRERNRSSRPSRCPRCRSGRLTEPRFSIRMPRRASPSSPKR